MQLLVDLRLVPPLRHLDVDVAVLQGDQQLLECLARQPGEYRNQGSPYVDAAVRCMGTGHVACCGSTACRGALGTA